MHIARPKPVRSCTELTFQSVLLAHFMHTACAYALSVPVMLEKQAFRWIFGIMDAGLGWFYPSDLVPLPQPVFLEYPFCRYSGAVDKFPIQISAEHDAETGY